MPDNAVVELGLDPRSAVAALTHDPKLDDMALLEALKSPALYVGVLGSRANNAKRRERLLRHFDLSEAEVARLHGPVGLPIGSRTPPEIAGSILAEITAIKNGLPPFAARNGYPQWAVPLPHRSAARRLQPPSSAFSWPPAAAAASAAQTLHPLDDGRRWGWPPPAGCARCCDRILRWCVWTATCCRSGWQRRVELITARPLARARATTSRRASALRRTVPLGLAHRPGGHAFIDSRQLRPRGDCPALRGSIVGSEIKGVEGIRRGFARQWGKPAFGRF